MLFHVQGEYSGLIPGFLTDRTLVWNALPSVQNTGWGCPPRRSVRLQLCVNCCAQSLPVITAEWGSHFLRSIGGVQHTHTARVKVFNPAACLLDMLRAANLYHSHCKEASNALS